MARKLLVNLFPIYIVNLFGKGETIVFLIIQIQTPIAT